ncbi:4656_t:CDS:2, partial [Acaulospora morrowiae]
YMIPMEDVTTGLISSNSHSEEVPVAGSVHSFAWSSTPLGPRSSWSPSLKTTVDLCLNSVLPTAICYGPEWILIYNQAWGTLLNSNHPTGRPVSEVRTETYVVLEPLVRGVFSTGKSQLGTDTPIPVQRGDDVEECYFSLALSPMFKEDGTVGGVFIVVQETTQRILAARRMKTL